MKNKVFNKEEALDGKPVVTRAGDKVSSIRMINSSATRFILVGKTSDEKLLTWNSEGRYLNKVIDSQYDVFME